MAQSLLGDEQLHEFMIHFGSVEMSRSQGLLE